MSEYASRIAAFLPTQQELVTFADTSNSEILRNTFDRMITWFQLLTDIKGQEESIVLVSAAHSKIIEIWILIPLGLIHSSYTALRTFVDICTSYTYYCSHQVEWAAVCEDRASWEGRGSIIDWHVQFTPSFREINKEFRLSELLNRDYQELSKYVHGIPVTGLPTLRSIERPNITDQNLDEFIKLAEKTNENLNLLFLSIFHQNLASLSTIDYRKITKGINRGKLASANIPLPRN